MSKDEKGFWDGVIDDMDRLSKIELAMNMSRDKNGKANPIKATGAAIGMDLSFDDLALMDCLLAEEGALGGNPFSPASKPAAPPAAYTAPGVKAAPPADDGGYSARKAETVAEKKKSNVVCNVTSALSVLFCILVRASNPSISTEAFCIILLLAVLAFVITKAVRAKKKYARQLLELELEYSAPKKDEKLL